MDSDLLSLFEDSESEVEEVGVCCGEKMKLNNSSSFLICRICNNMIEYIEELFQKPESQKIQYDIGGNAHFGKSSAKTKDEKIKDLMGELINKILQTNLLDSKTALATSKLVSIITSEHTKKKDNRNQLFAACLFLSAVKDGYIITIKDLVEIFNLKKNGIKSGLNMVTKYVILNGMDIEVDPPIYKLLIYKYLKNVSKFDDKYIKGDILTTENINFCICLVEFMLNNSIAYNTKIYTKCTATVYYLVYRNKLYVGSKKQLSTAMGGVGQNTTTTALNILMDPEVQDLLPNNLKFDF